MSDYSYKPSCLQSSLLGRRVKVLHCMGEGEIVNVYLDGLHREPVKVDVLWQEGHISTDKCMTQLTVLPDEPKLSPDPKPRRM